MSWQLLSYTAMVGRPWSQDGWTEYDQNMRRLREKVRGVTARWYFGISSIERPGPHDYVWLTNEQITP